jgi:hypothetical protein
MKKNIIIINKKILIIITGLLLMFQNCSLDEDVYSIYTSEDFYKNDFQVFSSLSGIYRSFASTPTFGAQYRILMICTDEVAVHSKIQGWWGGDNFWDIQYHTWKYDNDFITNAWNDWFKTIGQANALIPVLKESTAEGLEGPIAELRSLRGYAYFYLMDLWGNVPVFTEAKVDPKNLPTQNKRVEVYDFIVKELEEAVVDLPAKADVNSSYYGRLTKEAVYALLAYINLNSEVYTGVARYDKVVEYTDLVIAGGYELLEDYFDNFSPDNEENAEAIWSGVYTPDIQGGLGHPIVQKVLPGIQGGLFGLPYTPQNGFGTRPSVVERYEEQDVRKNMFLLPGVLLDPRNGDTVFVEEIIPDNNSKLYEPGVSTKGPVPYEIIAATDIKLQPMNAGIKWIKWAIDPNTSGGAAGNDIAFFRYADILLMKAEALQRSGQPGALELVNQIRERSNATPLTDITLEDIYEERGRELCFEMKRRIDMVRFDKFGGVWEFKEASGDYRKLYPIPKDALDANPNLVQNPGY